MVASRRLARRLRAKLRFITLDVICCVIASFQFPWREQAACNHTLYCRPITCSRPRVSRTRGEDFFHSSSREETGGWLLQASERSLWMRCEGSLRGAGWEVWEEWEVWNHGNGAPAHLVSVMKGLVPGRWPGTSAATVRSCVQEFFQAAGQTHTIFLPKPIT